MMGRDESKEAGMMVDNARYDADLGRREEKLVLVLVDTSDEYETEVIEGLKSRAEASNDG